MIRRRRPSLARRLLALTLAVMTGSVLLPASMSAGATSDLLPDLRMLPPASFAVCGAPTGGTFQTENCPGAGPEDRWLRFDSVLYNAGRATFRVVASRPSTVQAHMHATQWIRQSDKSWRKQPTDATLAWALEEDGHPHWHTQGMERYRLFRLPSPFPGGAKVGVKRGYCFFDGLLVRPNLTWTRRSPMYSFFDCGVPGQSQNALKLRVGLSVGWGDEYPWDYAGQRIDISGVEQGEYLLCLTADPAGEFTEISDANNESWARIRLATQTSPSYEVDVDVLARGRGPCQDRVPYGIAPLATG